MCPGREHKHDQLRSINVDASDALEYKLRPLIVKAIWTSPGTQRGTLSEVLNNAYGK